MTENCVPYYGCCEVDKYVTGLNACAIKFGAGPIVIKMLVDSGVNGVLSAELGPGASALLEQHNVVHVVVKPSTIVKESVRKALVKLRSEARCRRMS